MSPKSIFVLGLSIVLLGAGTSVGGEIYGILGESVAFRVKTSPPFKLISWDRISSGKSELIALLTFGESCGLQIPSQTYEKRVTISEDCRELHLGCLKKEDAGRFVAEIFPPDGEKVVESFDLQIFQHTENLRMETRLPLWALLCLSKLGSLLLLGCLGLILRVKHRKGTALRKPPEKPSPLLPLPVFREKTTVEGDSTLELSI